MATRRSGLTRGDVVTVAAGGGFGGKPRPALVIQAGAIRTTTVVLALFTSEVDRAEPVRPSFEPTELNGLRQRSELTVDVLVTVRREKIGAVPGSLRSEDMMRVDRALLALLGLAS